MRDSDWSILPLEVLRHAFELQPNGLDNTAASSTCKAWRAALQGSTAGSVCLQAISDRQEQGWHRLLSSRSGFDSLKLVRAASWTLDSVNEWTLESSDDIAQATFNIIPTACRSLTLSEFCSRYLAQYVERLPQLEQLTFECNALPLRRPQTHKTPELTLLKGLTELTVKMRNDSTADKFPALIQCCPDSLQSLNLHGFGKFRTADQEQTPVKTLHLLDHYLPELTQLQLVDSSLWIDEHIQCLSKLKSLSLADSQVYAEQTLELECLTALTFLDLSQTAFLQSDGSRVNTLDSFTAWPNLVVLKIKGCNLFNGITRVDLAMVKEADVTSSLFDAEVEVRTLHLHALPDEYLVQTAIRDFDYFYCELIVGVKLVLKQGSAQVAMAQMCKELPRLYDLELLIASPNSDHMLRHAFKPILPLQLTSLHIGGVACTNLELFHLTSLVSLNLSQIDTAGTLGYIVFPAGLQALTFIGNSLFGHTAQHNLLDLANLSEVTLRPYYDDGNQISPKSSKRFVQEWHLILPRLPACVTHLTVHEGHCSQIGDWTALAHCHRLQHLTLGSVHLLGRSRKLQMIIRALSCLLVVDYALDSLQEIGTLRGTSTRLPDLEVDDIPQVDD